jgi:predicted transcriptional regulator
MLSVLTMLEGITKRSPSEVFDKLFDQAPDFQPVEVIVNQEALHKFRGDAGLSLLELAKRAGLSVGSVHAAELMPVNAQADTVLGILEVLSQKLEKSPQWLLEQLL